VSAAADVTSSRVLDSSLPHRGPADRTGIANAFLGVTSWQAVCRAFGLDPSVLPHTVLDIRDRLSTT
jgi:hypothetical protein